jgi:hypothetical protein
MDIKISKTFLRAIHNAAEQLNSENRNVHLKTPFSGFCVKIEMPDKYHSEWFIPPENRFANQ